MPEKNFMTKLFLLFIIPFIISFGFVYWIFFMLGAPFMIATLFSLVIGFVVGVFSSYIIVAIGYLFKPVVYEKKGNYSASSPREVGRRHSRTVKRINKSKRKRKS